MTTATATAFTPGQRVKYVGSMTPACEGLSGTVISVNDREVQVNFEGDRDSDYVRGVLHSSIEAAEFILHDQPVGTQFRYTGLPMSWQAFTWEVTRQGAGDKTFAKRVSSTDPSWPGNDLEFWLSSERGPDETYSAEMAVPVELKVPTVREAYRPVVNDEVVFVQEGIIRLGVIERVDHGDNTAYIKPLTPFREGRGIYSTWVAFGDIGKFEVSGSIIQAPFGPTDQEVEMALWMNLEKAKVARMEAELTRLRRSATSAQQRENEIRDYLISIKDSHGWCDTGFNRHLEELGMEPLATDYTFEVTITVTGRVCNAEDEDQAQSWVADALSVSSSDGDVEGLDYSISTYDVSVERD